MIFDDLMRDLQARRDLVDIRRDDLDADDIRGFFLDVSVPLLLIRIVGDDIRYDGFTVIDRGDVTFLRWGTGKLRGWERALAARDDDGRCDAPPVDLSGWHPLVVSLRRHTGLVTFHRERLDAGTCYVSDDFECSESLLVGRQVTPEGIRDGSFALRLGDLTRVDVGGRYESGLQQMLGG